ncbi:MAG TPA: hypothetical protein VF526_00780, partial [Solirubrobacteraceae bacterium]
LRALRRRPSLIIAGGFPMSALSVKTPSTPKREELLELGDRVAVVGVYGEFVRKTGLGRDGRLRVVLAVGAAVP